MKNVSSRKKFNYTVTISADDYLKLEQMDTAALELLEFHRTSLLTTPKKHKFCVLIRQRMGRVRKQNHRELSELYYFILPGSELPCDPFFKTYTLSLYGSRDLLSLLELRTRLGGRYADLDYCEAELDNELKKLF
jgi:hypothetical protein